MKFTRLTTQKSLRLSITKVFNKYYDEAEKLTYDDMELILKYFNFLERSLRNDNDNKLKQLEEDVINLKEILNEM